jgi:hypothetical protein
MDTRKEGSEVPKKNAPANNPHHDHEMMVVFG